jgi:hypothetical protein
VIGGLAGGVEAEVGAAAVGGVDPLGSGVVDVLGDQVQVIGGAAAGLADVGAGGAGVLVEDQVAGVGGLPWMPCTVPA